MAKKCEKMQITVKFAIKWRVSAILLQTNMSNVGLFLCKIQFSIECTQFQVSILNIQGARAILSR